MRFGKLEPWTLRHRTGEFGVLGFHVKPLKTFEVVPFSLGIGVIGIHVWNLVQGKDRT